ncbi:MAG: hypothetical protein M1544_03195 [Candidatus Marsarchaeota archaeon]|nr:hypothetical protein [Candidatus Marsarchaeota archaeon]
MVDKHIGRDWEGTKEFVTMNISRFNFTEIKEYLTRDIVPRAIKEYAEICIEGTDNRIESSNIDPIIKIAGRIIDNSLQQLSEMTIEYEKKHGWTKTVESNEQTIRLWERSRLKLVDYAYFEEIVIDSLNEIREGHSTLDFEHMPDELHNAIERIWQS